MRDNPVVRQRIMEIFHDSVVGGHYGMQVTAKRIASLFYWKGWERDIMNYIRDCEYVMFAKGASMTTLLHQVNSNLSLFLQKYGPKFQWIFFFDK